MICENLWNLTSFVARQRIQSVFTETFTNQVQSKYIMICVPNMPVHTLFKAYCIFLAAEIMNASILMYLKSCGILTSFAARQRIQSVFT